MCPNNKKAQGLSLNTIIIAAIVLIVLIVLWAIFTGRMGGFTEEVARCKGTCRNECEYPDWVEDPQGKCGIEAVDADPIEGYEHTTLKTGGKCCISLK